MRRLLIGLTLLLLTACGGTSTPPETVPPVSPPTAPVVPTPAPPVVVPAPPAPTPPDPDPTPPPAVEPTPPTPEPTPPIPEPIPPTPVPEPTPPAPEPLPPVSVPPEPTPPPVEPVPTPPDITPPTAALTAETAVITVPGQIQLSGTALDDRQVARVELLKNGQVLRELAAPYTFSQNVFLKDAGKVLYSLRVTDAAGNVQESAPVSLLIQPPAQAFAGRVASRDMTGLRAELLRGPQPALLLGNSIISAGWWRHLGTRLSSLTAEGMPETWTASLQDWSVGGTMLSQAAFLTAPILPTGATNYAQTLPNPALNGIRWAVVGGLRNETPYVDAPGFLAATRIQLEAMLDDLIARGIEPVMLTDPPQLNEGSGEYSAATLTADPRLLAIQREVTAAKGVTLVDVWAELDRRKQAGEDLRSYYADGTHQNEAGNRLIADLVTAALLTEPSTQSQRPAPSATALAIAYPSGPNWTTTTTTSRLSTERARGQAEVYHLAPGESVTFGITSSAAWGNVVLQPQCEARLNWQGASLMAVQTACSGVSSLLHREQTVFLGSASGLLTATNTTSQPLELIGVLVTLPR